MCSSQSFIRLCLSRHHHPPNKQSSTTSYIIRLSVSASPFTKSSFLLSPPLPPAPLFVFNRTFTISQLKSLNLHSHSGQRFLTTVLPFCPFNHHTTVPKYILQWSIQNIIHTKSDLCCHTLLPFHSPGAIQENLTLEFRTYFVE